MPFLPEILPGTAAAPPGPHAGRTPAVPGTRTLRLLQLRRRIEMLRTLVHKRAIPPDLELLVDAELHRVGKHLCVGFIRTQGRKGTGERAVVIEIADFVA